MNDICTNCNKRKATTNWVGEGGMMDFVHGMYTRWCEYCVTKAQLKYCKKMVRAIPRLEKKLLRLGVDKIE